MTIVDYKKLVSDNTTQQGWVNASKWCKAYGRKWRDFSKNNGVRKYLKHLQHKALNGVKPTRVEGKGRNAQTYVHPLVAIKLAEWLDPDFEVYVKDTFKRFLEGDITLADEIIQRQTKTENIEWISERVEGKKARHYYTDELKLRGVTGIGYAMNSNALYLGLFDKKASDLREELKISNPRDGMSALQLAATRFAELGAIERMKRHDARGNKQTTKQSNLAAKEVRKALDSFTN